MYSGPPAPAPSLQHDRTARPPRRKGPWIIAVGVLIAFVIAPILAVVALSNAGDSSGAAGALPLLNTGQHQVQIESNRTAVVYAYVGETSAPNRVSLNNPDDLTNVTPLCRMTGPGGSSVPVAVQPGMRVVRDGGAFDRSYVYRPPGSGSFALTCNTPVLLDTQSSVEMSGVASVARGFIAGGVGFIVGAVVAVCGIVVTVKESRRRTMAAMFPARQHPHPW